MSGAADQTNDRPRRGSVFSWLWLWRSRRAAACLPRLTLEATSDGFDILADGEPDWSLRWDEIDGVVAFKQDRMSYDTICFGFARRGDAERLWCIDEDMEGFDAIRAGIERVSHGAWPRDSARVIYPAFKTCWTVLRADPGSAASSYDLPLVWVVRDTEAKSE